MDSDFLHHADSQLSLLSWLSAIRMV